MPFYLDVVDVIPEVADLESVLIVPCRFCPAASMAVRNNEPYIEFPRRGLKTACYERLIDTVKHSLETRGIKASVFRSNWLHQFVLCMWTSKRRKELLERVGELLSRKQKLNEIESDESAGKGFAGPGSHPDR